jgi:hypothetical protein
MLSADGVVVLVKLVVWAGFGTRTAEGTFFVEEKQLPMESAGFGVVTPQA